MQKPSLTKISEKCTNQSKKEIVLILQPDIGVPNNFGAHPRGPGDDVDVSALQDSDP